MAKYKTVWLDDNGGEHESDEAAERANLRFRAEMTLRSLDPDFGIVDLSHLEGVNHQTLEPLKIYIDTLMRESMERTKKHG